ncbi:MAG: exonuclease SbcCD subunit D C-terminal domain-containing protein [Bacteroidetes bacterium]|nr:exonuclease SbcCD subunit D C-terminal domain-containing protein [Bacteroidota bacterium]
MKMLHTADWHLGKKLHKHDLAPDHQLFINWLESYIRENVIDILLISGDVFDLANPSSEARALYYDALVRFNQLNCTVIITGGNHDSPSVLNAPKDVLKALNIHVVGGLPTDLEKVLIPLPNKENPEVIIAAIPFLRDADLRQMNEGESYDDRIEAVRKGIEHTYTHVAEIAKKQYPKIPCIALGHLYAAGVNSSDSEREIQIGNQAKFEASAFGEYYKYVALGHIHKPQKVGAQIPTYYSGSPIALSFSERKDEKRMLLIDTQKGFEPENVPLPNFRLLKRFTGNYEEVSQSIGAFSHNGDLPALLELELFEEHYNPETIYALDRLVFEYENDNAQVVKHRITFKNQVQGTASLFAEYQQLDDLKPTEVFEKRLAAENLDEETTQLLKQSFSELLEELS